MLKIALESCRLVGTAVRHCWRLTTKRVHEDLGAYNLI